MAEYYLDFEKPIAELDQKIADLIEMNSKDGADHSSEITRLKDKRDKLESVLRTAREKDPSTAFAEDGEFPGDILLLEAAKILVDTAIELEENRILAQSNDPAADRSVATQDQ